MSKTFRGERSIGGNIVYVDGHPLDKHTEVAALSPHTFDWGPDADPDAVLQLSIAILTERRDWKYAAKYYRAFAAALQEYVGERDEWELKTSDIIEMDYTERSEGEIPLPRPFAPPERISISGIDLDKMNKIQEYALCKRYNIKVFVDREDRLEKLRKAKAEGPTALETFPPDDRGAASTSLDEFESDDQAETISNAASSSTATASGQDGERATSEVTPGSKFEWVERDKELAPA